MIKGRIILLGILLLLTAQCGDEALLKVAPEIKKNIASRTINLAPVANAGPDQNINLPLSSVNLNGAKSTDSDGIIKSWLWTKKSGPASASITTPTGTTTTVRNLVQGTYIFTLEVTDDLGKIGTDDVTIRVVQAGPTIASFSPAFGLPGTIVTITGTNFTAPLSVTFNGVAASISAFTQTSLSVAVPANATTGPISVSNGTQVSSTSNFTIAAIPAPTITSFTPVTGLPGTTVTISGTNFSAPLSVTFNGTAASIVSSTSTSVTVTVPANATSGPISVSNGTQVSSTSIFTVGSIQPPTISNFTPAFGLAGTTVTITGTNFTAPLTVNFNGTPATILSFTATSVTVTVPANATTGPISISNGTQVLSAKSFTVSATPPPTISSFTPTSGLTGATVTITGTNFTTPLSVSFNGTPATIASSTATSITVTVPANATTGPISVSNGTSVLSSSNFTVSATPPPTITSFTPAFGLAGTTVTIKGTYFNTPLSVTFNGVVATVSSFTSTTITTTVPANATSGPISVSNGTPVTSSTSFTVASVPPPTISSFTPTSGLIGSSVTIKGTNFVSPLSVTFNGVAAVITASSSTSITATVPANATTGPISVSNGTKVTTASNFTVTTLSPPVITSFSPASGIIGTSVTITGSNFTAPLSVSFNGVAATITSSSSTSITTSVPANATTGPISVSNGLNVNSSSNFTVTTTPPVLDVYFQGDMQAVSVAPLGTSGYKLTGWTGLYSNPMISGIYLNNLAASQYAYQQMVPDPAGSGRTVMMGRILDDDPNQVATSRAQMTMSFVSGTSLAVYHTSHRMYINPDLSYLSNYSGLMDWFGLAEFWNMHDATMDGDTAGSARWGLSINKDAPVGSPMYWVCYGEYMQPATLTGQDIFKYTNKTVPIPFGKWFTLDLYLKRGDATNGHMTVKITPDGGATTTLFDFTGATMYPGKPALWLDTWQPFKLYIGDVYMDWMRGNNKIMSIYYNDYTWYKN